jgi:hypothetical protein
MTGAIIHIGCLLALWGAVDGGAPSTAPPVKTPARSTADGGAGATAKTPARAAVETALATGSGAADLQELAARAPGELIGVASDRTVSEAVRGRALAALAYARTARVHAFLENFIVARTPSSEPSDRALLRRAATALGWQGGPRLVEVIAPLLDNPDADVRQDAAAALAIGRARDAEAPLRARLVLEKDPAVRRQIDAALQAVAPAP